MEKVLEEGGQRALADLVLPPAPLLSLLAVHDPGRLPVVGQGGLLGRVVQQHLLAAAEVEERTPLHLLCGTGQAGRGG